uniref:Uncharacterized protein n=1 Tax=Ascaris lumbricoides TaxID=6252 RepID=A0A0M3IU50_ASCLU
MTERQICTQTHTRDGRIAHSPRRLFARNELGAQTTSPLSSTAAIRYSGVRIPHRYCNKGITQLMMCPYTAGHPPSRYGITPNIQVILASR